jgi:hypothetical protein
LVIILNMDSPNLRRLFAAAVPRGSDEEDDPYGLGRLLFAVTYEVARRSDTSKSILLLFRLCFR